MVHLKVDWGKSGSSWFAIGTFTRDERILTFPTTLRTYQVSPGGSRTLLALFRSHDFSADITGCYHASEEGNTTLANENLVEQTRVERVVTAYVSNRPSFMGF